MEVFGELGGEDPDELQQEQEKGPAPWESITAYTSTGWGVNCEAGEMNSEEMDLAERVAKRQAMSPMRAHEGR